MFPKFCFCDLAPPDWTGDPFQVPDYSELHFHVLVQFPLFRLAWDNQDSLDGWNWGQAPEPTESSVEGTQSKLP